MMDIIIFHVLTNSMGSVYGGIVIHEGVVIIWETTCNNRPKVIVNDVNVFFSFNVASTQVKVPTLLKDMHPHTIKLTLSLGWGLFTSESFLQIKIRSFFSMIIWLSSLDIQRFHSVSTVQFFFSP